MIRFTVPGLPIAQPRQRHTRTGVNYTPTAHPVNAFKAAVRLAAQQEWAGRALIEGPVAVRILCVFPVPKAMMRKNRCIIRVPCPKKPDVDNLFKSIADALNHVIWVDDSQIVNASISKMYAASAESPHVDLEITEA